MCLMAPLLTFAIAQTTAPAPTQVPAEDETVAAVRLLDEQFAEGLRELERQRLDGLYALARGRTPEQAESIYLAYFQAAIASGIYEKAEPLAEGLVHRDDAPAPLLYLAHLVNMLAEVDRGDYKGSLASVRAAVALGAKDEEAGVEGASAVATALPQATRASLVEAFYQKLVQAGQFQVAREALKLISEESSDESIRDLAADRLARVERVGQPAPPIVGEDVDGRPVDLASMKGKVVLVVFWASWSLPSAAEARYLDALYEKYRDRDFEILGINLDTKQEGVTDPSSMLPAVRRFLIDHNVRWQNVLNGEGDQDYAKAYGVDEIPASFLVGRDGQIERIDLNPGQFNRAISEAVAR